MKAVLYTDGGAWPNPGPGAWAFALAITPDNFDPVTDDPKAHPGIVVWGSDTKVTNNQMEMRAAIRGLRYITKTKEAKTYPLFVVADSLYVIQGAQKEQKVGPLFPNKDLWEKLWMLVAKTKPVWIHVRGHQGVLGNELVDLYCTMAQKTGPKEGFVKWN